MRKSLLALPLIALLASACGGQAPALPDESTMSVPGPDDSDGGSTSQPLCAAGEEPEKALLKREIDEMNEAGARYRALYQAVRRVVRFTAKNGGEFERTFTGPNGSITVDAEEQADASVKIDVLGMSVGEDAQQRLIMQGTVSADALSGTWKIFAKDGSLARTISWTKTAAGDLTAHWKNEKNGKTADYTRTGKDVLFKLTQPSGATIEYSWNVDTKIGSAAHLNASGELTAKVCWDASFCTAACQ